MATTIGLKVGQLEAFRTFSNDQRAQALLLAIYRGAALGPEDATNAQKLAAVTDYIVSFIQQEAFRFLLSAKRQDTDAQQSAEAVAESRLE